MNIGHTILLTLSCQTFGDGLRASPGDSLSSSGIQQAAITFVQKYLNISSPMGVTFTSGCKSGNMTYAYVQQTDVSQFPAQVQMLP